MQECMWEMPYTASNKLPQLKKPPKYYTAQIPQCYSHLLILQIDKLLIDDLVYVWFEACPENIDCVPSVFSPSAFFYCPTNSTCWISFVYSNQLLLVYDFWLIHNLTNVLMYNFHLVLLLTFLFLRWLGHQKFFLLKMTSYF